MNFYYFNNHFTDIMKGCKHLAQIATTLWQPSDNLTKLQQGCYKLVISIWVKHILETNLIRGSYHVISHSFHFNSHLQQEYISNNMEQFSYKRCVWYMWAYMHILRCLKEVVAWALDKRIWVISY